jgi:hypothetical protein
LDGFFVVNYFVVDNFVIENFVVGVDFDMNFDYWWIFGFVFDLNKTYLKNK